MHKNAVAAALESISLGPSIVVNNLTMIPLVRRDSNCEPATERPRGRRSGGAAAAARTPSLDARAAALDYSVLDDALMSGSVDITEVSEQGSVPDLKFVNRGACPVLIVDGEELLGAKQNRIVNLSILVAADSELTIPVSCVEAGRWRSRSHHFTAAPRTQYATGRAKRMADVSLSMLARGDRMSDQADVWQDIAAKSFRLEASSPTSAMEAIFDRHGVSIDTYVEGCRPIDGQVGALFAVDDTLIGFDLFDRPSTLRKLLPKLVRSVAVDAIDAATAHSSSEAAARDPRGLRREAEASIVRMRGEQFLAVTAGAPQHVTAALGLGQDARLTAPHIAGAALVNDNHVIHLGAFAL